MSADPTRSTILEEEFTLGSRASSLRVGLTQKSLRLDDEHAIALDDIVGTRVEESYINGDSNAYLLVDTCERSSEGKNTIRRQSSIRLSAAGGKSRAKNLEIVRKWDRVLKLMAQNANYYTNKTKPFLIFVNPNSGSGRASEIFLKHTVNIWSKANATFEAIITERKDHAKQVITSIDLSKYRGIIVVSGDGLIHEILNGLLSRNDWKQSIEIPIGQIPAGSANGLASSSAFVSGEQFQSNHLEQLASRMAFLLTKFKPTHMDVLALQMQDGSFLYSFMNIEWAIVADVDSESEQYRFLGSLRFVLQFFIRILNLRVYHGRISFLPADTINLKDKTVEIKTNTDNYSSEAANKTRLVNDHLGVKFTHLKPIEKPVPNEWLTIEDKFVLFLVINLPLMGMDFLISPAKRFDDGYALLCFVREGISRLDMFKFLVQCSQGVILANPYIECIKVKAFRLEPLDDKIGSLMVDGESVKYGSIQGEIIPKFAKTFTNPIK